MTILDTYSGSLVTKSGFCVSGSSEGVFSLQGRFDGAAADVSDVLVCLMIAENADESFCSRSSPNRGTMTLVGDAVTHDDVCVLFKDDDNGTLDFIDDDDVLCCSI